MENRLPLESLAASATKVFIEAPAGCGKTQFIVHSIRDFCHGRQLVLTHTFAGVHALRNRFDSEHVDKSKFKIDTIAGFCVDYVRAYPQSCGVSPTALGDHVDWAQVYAAMLRLLEKPFVKKTVRASFSGLFVDEYQDCSTAQHAVILILSELIPTRIFGDPLQAIFNFRRDEPNIDWGRDVQGNFQSLGILNTPHRWNNANCPELGRWLIDHVRPTIMAGGLPSFSNLPSQVRVRRLTGEAKTYLQQQANVCRWPQVPDGENLAIISSGSKVKLVELLSKNLKGKFYLIEPMECEELISMAREYDEEQLENRCFYLARKMKQWISNTSKCFPASIFDGRLPPDRPRFAETRKLFSTHHASSHLKILETLKTHVHCNLHRKELFQDLQKALRSLANETYSCLLESVIATRERTRKMGRRLPLRTIGRTLLIKGLEFDHAIILNFHELKPYEQYVALTRASKSVTIFLP